MDLLVHRHVGDHAICSTITVSGARLRRSRPLVMTSLFSATFRRTPGHGLGWGSPRTPRAVAVPRPEWAKAGGISRAVNHGVDLLQWGGSHSLFTAARMRPPKSITPTISTRCPLQPLWPNNTVHAYVFDTHELSSTSSTLEPRPRSSAWASRTKQKLVQKELCPIGAKPDPPDECRDHRQRRRHR